MAGQKSAWVGRLAGVYVDGLVGTYIRSLSTRLLLDRFGAVGGQTDTGLMMIGIWLCSAMEIYSGRVGLAEPDVTILT